MNPFDKNGLDFRISFIVLTKKLQQMLQKLKLLFLKISYWQTKTYTPTQSQEAKVLLPFEV